VLQRATYCSSTVFVTNVHTTLGGIISKEFVNTLATKESLNIAGS